MDQGTTVRAARAKLRMTQASVAAAAGVSVNTVKRAEAGHPVQDETIRNLCAVLGLHVASFPRTPHEAEEARPGPVPDWPVSDTGPGLLARRDIQAVLPVAVATLPFALAWGIGRLSGAEPVVSASPEPFAWLTAVAVNQAFSEAMMLTLCLFAAASAVGFAVARARRRPHALDASGAGVDWTPIAYMACLLVLLPAFDGWGVLQWLVMMPAGYLGDGNRISWTGGILLVIAQAYAVARLARFCAPLVRVPALVPCALAVSFVEFVPEADVARGIGVALAIVCAAAMRLYPGMRDARTP